jgi:hypothetical protein
MIIQVERHFVKELFSIFNGWTNDTIVKFNDTSKGKMGNYSPEERAKLNNDLMKLKDDCAKFETNLVAEEKFVVENLNALMELSLDFQNWVVDPVYQGNVQKAVSDLMRKAVEEQKAKSKLA